MSLQIWLPLHSDRRERLFAQIVLRGIWGICVSTVKMVTLATHQAFWVCQLLVRSVTAVVI